MELYPYQKKSVDFILEKKNCALFLSMGSGKTAIVLTALSKIGKKSLIIAPKRIAENVWDAEISKWEHLSSMKISIIAGNEKERLDKLKETADVYVISKDNINWLIENHAQFFDFKVLVYDELSCFKNPKSKRFKTLLKVYDTAEYHIGLTGTPAPNGYEDLWCQYMLIDKGERLGNKITHYLNRYFYPAKKNGYVVYKWGITEENKRIIEKKINDITLSYKNTNINIPQVNTYLCAIQQTNWAYEEMKARKCLSIDGYELAPLTKAVYVNSLIQLANDNIYTQVGKETARAGDSKQKFLKQLLKNNIQGNSLIAYWYKFSRSDIIEVLDSMKLKWIDIIDDIDGWNNGEYDIGLLHPGSAGHGLNLQFGGHNLIWYTLPWSLEFYEQTSARLVRPGQNSPVVNQYLMVNTKSYEKNVLTALENKQNVQDQLLRVVEF